MSGRETALNVLIACRTQEGWSNARLKDTIFRDRLDRREAALATRLCYGVVQNRGYLDFYLAQLLTGKIKDLHPIIRDILHLGLYQLMQMEKIPQSAAVNESVTLAKKYCKKQKFAPGLVNGVLRNYIRSAEKLKKPTSLADKYSHPQELVDALQASVGEEKIETILRANNEIAPLTVQVNTLKTTSEELMGILEEEGIGVLNHPWLTDCFILNGTGNLENLPSFQKGLFYVQDSAAKVSVLCADFSDSHLQVLDCCAAPGGKSFTAAMAMKGKGDIYSCDIHNHKITLLQKGAQRLGISGMTAVLQDATQENPQWRDKMDVVIADVPCSGYGIIRKKPDIRYKNLKAMEDLPQLQLEILENQCKYVKPGGILLYSTCTVLRRENEEVVQAFLQNHPQYCPEPLPLPDVFPKNSSGMYTFLPGEQGTDGFFVCRLRRKL